MKRLLCYHVDLKLTHGDNYDATTGSSDEVEAYHTRSVAMSLLARKEGTMHTVLFGFEGIQVYNCGKAILNQI